MPSLARSLLDLARAVVSAAGSTPTAPARTSARTSARKPATSKRPVPARKRSGAQYAPHADGQPDPGEVVWAWVAYEEDASRGKDRPVLVVRRDGARLTALMLTSKDHDRDAADEARFGRRWMDVGAGAWDRERRPSEVRLDRVLHLDAGEVRREGAALDRAVFDQVVAAADLTG